MKYFLIRTIRIISGVAFPIGTAYLIIFLLLTVLNQDTTLYGVIFSIVFILFFFVFPLLVILFVNSKNCHETTAITQNGAEARPSFLKRPLNKGIVITIFVLIGIIPVVYLILIEIGGFSDH